MAAASKQDMSFLHGPKKEEPEEKKLFNDEKDEFANEYSFINDEERIKMEMLKKIKEVYERSLRNKRSQ